jgi:hypothetical protein
VGEGEGESAVEYEGRVVRMVIGMVSEGRKVGRVSDGK